MRLANGIVIDKEATFGALKFSALRREVHLQNEDGSVSEEIKERTLDTEEPEHNLHSEAQEPISDNDKLLLELLKSMTPEMKEKLLKETLSNC